MKGSLTLGRVAGIRIAIHWTFILLIIYVIFSKYREGADSPEIAWALAFIMSVFVTVVLHELGHALAAKRFHINTRDITLLPIGGVARMERIPEKPVEELVVAIAGPMVNILIAAILKFFLSWDDLMDLIQHPDEAIDGQNFMLNFFFINVFLVVFNMIPAFPMDGGRVFRAVLSMMGNRRKATIIAARVGQLLAIGFIILGFYSNPFLIFIGLFIILSAQSELEMVTTGMLMKGRTVGDAIMKNYETLQSDDSVNQAVSKLLDGSSKSFLVLSNGQPVGTVGRNQIIRALSEGKQENPVLDIMDPHLLSFDSKTPVEEVLQKLNDSNQELALVTRNGYLIGLTDSENILEYVMIIAANTQKN